MSYFDKVKVEGDIAHDSSDSGNPVKVGGRAIDMKPDSGAEEGPSSVTADDRVNGLFDLKGRLYTGVNAKYIVLSDINTTYDDSPTTAVSADIECWQYRKATLAYDLTETGAATDITIQVEVSLDGTNFEILTNWGLSSLVYTDDQITASPSNTLKEAITFDIACQEIRVRVTATGSNGSNSFTMANATLYFRD